MTWDENDPTPPTSPSVKPRRVAVDVDALDDGRCTASSWNGPRPAKPTYQNLFGPGGYNRCIGADGHANPVHKDEWGHVFTRDWKDGRLQVIRREDPDPRFTSTGVFVDKGTR